MPITCPGNTRLHFTMIAVFLPRTATASTDIHFGRPRLRSRRDDDLGARASGAQAGETRAPPGDALGTRASGAQRAGCLQREKERQTCEACTRARRPRSLEMLWVRASPARRRVRRARPRRCPGYARLRRAGGRDARAPRCWACGRDTRAPRRRARRPHSQEARGSLMLPGA